jgi:hypothetical protein
LSSLNLALVRPPEYHSAELRGVDRGRTASELLVYRVLAEPEMPVERILAQEYSNLSRDRQGSLANRMAGNRSLTVAARICGTIGDTEAMTWRVWRAALVFLGAHWLATQNAPPVPDIRQLEVPHHQGQSYWMFAPANYTADRAWPILYWWSASRRRRRRPASCWPGLTTRATAPWPRCTRPLT